ncbi:hypothetical protein A2U01_0021487, partial [Trifolium medium]|nr:hypothetical protein [Trifolium medium]
GVMDDEGSEGEFGEGETGRKACTSRRISGDKPEIKQLKRKGWGRPTIRLASRSNSVSSKLDLPCKEMQRLGRLFVGGGVGVGGGGGGVGMVVRAASWVMIASTLSLSSSKRSAFVRAMKVKRMRAPNC